VIPGRSSSYEQSCRHDIVPDYSEDYDCNVPRKGSKRYFAGGPHTLYFNILGTRPIAIEVAVLWVNHYPVDLHLSYDSEASGSGTLHVSHTLHLFTFKSQCVGLTSDRSWFFLFPPLLFQLSCRLLYILYMHIIFTECYPEFNGYCAHWRSQEGD
jgi:hypothetical protein